jgi:hypothetical protein
MGFVKVVVDDNGTPTKQIKHSPECAWCFSSALLLGLAGADSLHIPAALGREPAPILALQPITFLRHHAFAWAQAPPAFS